ncbi:L-2-hydroxyglutarate oxidase [Lacipirellula parvula]|uniref:L-2-hydroxyglutarate oxidase n=1 Tax=Lacipirellula parvula TaxID=2650471 RepID=A0A5K7XAJ6_9BACT|nr:L-2-hydroxyglutarate oxidase [Lacipirellula parvula]BBO31771.1 L-2-hydroxyglutarate oxidase [Lacipirellula parvula]
MPTSDLIVIGGGIVGLATAYKYQQQFPGRSVLLLEKESELAAHQTGRNSGVLHSGIYYKPGSLKAKNCREGKLAMEAFCQAEGVPYDICGKVIVALSDEELPRLDNIYERGQANGVKCEIISRERLLELEPHVAGIRAIHVPETGIVDYPMVCKKLAERIVAGGGEIKLGTAALGFKSDGATTIVETIAGGFAARQVVNCAGLYSDRVAALTGEEPPAKIIPFRGEYFELKHDAEHLVKNLIYPVPDPAFPFLGVHFTRMINGGVECGPNAVLAFAREGYFKSTINIPELAESLTYPGFLRLAAKYWKMGADEMWRSVSKRAFVRALARLVPEIKAEHLVAAPAGVRAQALMRDGSLVDDFLIESHGNVVNVLNAPSPAATSALTIGDSIVERLAAARS